MPTRGGWYSQPSSSFSAAINNSSSSDENITMQINNFPTTILKEPLVPHTNLGTNTAPPTEVLNTFPDCAIDFNVFRPESEVTDKSSKYCFCEITWVQCNIGAFKNFENFCKFCWSQDIKVAAIQEIKIAKGDAATAKKAKVIAEKYNYSLVLTLQWDNKKRGLGTLISADFKYQTLPEVINEEFEYQDVVIKASSTVVILQRNVYLYHGRAASSSASLFSKRLGYEVAPMVLLGDNFGPHEVQYATAQGHIKLISNDKWTYWGCKEGKEVLGNINKSLRLSNPDKAFIINNSITEPPSIINEDSVSLVGLVTNSPTAWGGSWFVAQQVVDCSDQHVPCSFSIWAEPTSKEIMNEQLWEFSSSSSGNLTDINNKKNDFHLPENWSVQRKYLNSKAGCINIKPDDFKSPTSDVLDNLFISFSKILKRDVGPPILGRQTFNKNLASKEITESKELLLERKSKGLDTTDLREKISSLVQESIIHDKHTQEFKRLSSVLKAGDSCSTVADREFFHFFSRAADEGEQATAEEAEEAFEKWSNNIARISELSGCRAPDMLYFNVGYFDESSVPECTAAEAAAAIVHSCTGKTAVDVFGISPLHMLHAGRSKLFTKKLAEAITWSWRKACIAAWLLNVRLCTAGRASRRYWNSTRK